MENQEKIIIAVTKLTTDKLTLDELAALNNVVSVDYDPHGRIFDYGIVKPLFTIEKGTKCHESIKEAIAHLFLERFETHMASERIKQ